MIEHPAHAQVTGPQIAEIISRSLAAGTVFGLNKVWTLPRGVRLGSRRVWIVEFAGHMGDDGVTAVLTLTDAMYAQLANGLPAEAFEDDAGQPVNVPTLGPEHDPAALRAVIVQLFASLREVDALDPDGVKPSYYVAGKELGALADRVVEMEFDG